MRGSSGIVAAAKTYCLRGRSEGSSEEKEEATPDDLSSRASARAPPSRAALLAFCGSAFQSGKSGLFFPSLSSHSLAEASLTPSSAARIPSSTLRLSRA